MNVRNPKDLIPNPISKKLYGDFTTTEQDDLALLLSINKEGRVVEPIHINENNQIISGNRRCHCAILSGIKEVDVIIEDIDEIDEYLTITHNIQRVKNPVMVAYEWKVINDKHGCKQGKPVPEEVKKIRKKILDANKVSQRLIESVFQLVKIKKEREGLNDEEAWKSVKEKVKDSVKVNYVLSMEREKYDALDDKEKAENAPILNTDSIKVIHKEASEISKEMGGEIVDCVCTSPPYASMKIYLDDEENVKDIERTEERRGKTQPGQEQTIDEYIDGIMDVFTQCRLVMKPTASMWINIMDKYIDGIEQRIPSKLIDRLENDGLTYIQTVYWYKTNTTPRFKHDKHFQSSFEYIIHVVKDSEKYKWRKAWHGKEANWLSNLTLGGEGKNKVFRNMITYPHDTRGLKGEELAKAAALLETTTISNHYVKKLLNKRGWSLQHNALQRLEVPAVCILSTTDSYGEDVVLDPYSGLGTTGLIAYANNCKYYGFERSKVYAVQQSIRLEDFVKNYSEYKLNNKNEIDF